MTRRMFRNLILTLTLAVGAGGCAVAGEPRGHWVDAHFDAVRAWEDARYTDALDHYHEALAIARARHGADDPRAAESLAGLGRSYLALGRTGEARRHLEHAFWALERRFGRYSEPLIRVAYDLGDLARAEGNPGEALSSYTLGLAIAIEKLGPEHAQVAYGLAYAGHALVDLGRVDEAKAVLERAHALAKLQPGEEVPLFYSALNGLARVYRARSEEGRARELRSRAEALALRGPTLPAPPALNLR